MAPAPSTKFSGTRSIWVTLLQKTYTTDFLKRIKNNGTVPQYYVRGDPGRSFKRPLHAGAGGACPSPGSPRQPDRQEAQFLLQSLFYRWTFCGDFAVSFTGAFTGTTGLPNPSSGASLSRLEPTSAEKNCTNRTVNELLLQEITVRRSISFSPNATCFLKPYSRTSPRLWSTLTPSPDGIQSRLLELQKELIKKANNKQDYDAIADEIFRLP